MVRYPGLVKRCAISFAALLHPGAAGHVSCLRNCALGPSVEVNGTVYGQVDAGQPDTQAAETTAAHITTFREPRMVTELTASPDGRTLAW